MICPRVNPILSCLHYFVVDVRNIWNLFLFGSFYRSSIECILPACYVSSYTLWVPALSIQTLYDLNFQHVCGTFCMFLYYIFLDHLQTADSQGRFVAAPCWVSITKRNDCNFYRHSQDRYTLNQLAQFPMSEEAIHFLRKHR